MTGRLGSDEMRLRARIPSWHLSLEQTWTSESLSLSCGHDRLLAEKYLPQGKSWAQVQGPWRPIPQSW